MSASSRTIDLAGARILVAGATGVLGGALAEALAREGAELALAGRDRGRLDEIAARLDAPSARFDAADGDSCRTAVNASVAALGGLDAIVVSVGVPGFGRCGEVGAAEVDALFAVNALGPMRLIDEALPHLEDPGAVVAISAIVAEHPMAGLAHYSAAKAALSAHLAALRRETRGRGVSVLDVRPPHLDTGFSERPLYGIAPALPEPVPHGEIVAAIVDALREGRREVAWDPLARRQHAR